MSVISRFHDFSPIRLLPSGTKLGQGNIFRSMCQEFCPQRGCLLLGGVCSQGRGAWSGGSAPGRVSAPRGVGSEGVCSQACVAGGGACGQGACMVGACMAGGHAWPGVGPVWLEGKGCAWLGGMCVAGGHVCGLGACMAGCMHGRGHAWPEGVARGCGRVHAWWGDMWHAHPQPPGLIP